MTTTPAAPSRVQRISLATLSALAVAGGLYALAMLPPPHGRPVYLNVLMAASWNLGYGVLAFLIAWRGGPDRGVLLAGWFLALMSTHSAMGLLGLRPDRDSGWIVLSFGTGAVMYGVGVRFTQSFPAPLSAEGIRSLRGRIGRAFARPAAFLLPAWRLWTAIAIAEVVQHGLFPGASIVWHVLLYAGLASYYLAAGLKLGGPEERRRGFWILEGVLIYLVLEGIWTAVLVARNTLGLSFGMSLFTQWLMAIEGLAALACFAIAIFFYGAFDSGLVVRRTIVVSVLSGVALLLIVTLEEILAGFVSQTTGIDAGVGAVLGGVVAALAFRPISTRLDAFLKSRMDTSARQPI
jgi:hypothetical protein